MAHPGIVYLDENSHPQASARQRTRCCAGFNGLCILGSLVSILGLFTLGLASPIGLVLSLLAFRRRPRFAATVGTLLGGAGTAFLALWGLLAVSAYNTAHYQDQAQQTEVVLQLGVQKIEHYRANHQALPRDIQGNKLLIADSLKDAWGEPLRYDVLDNGEFLVRSAGPDQTFDTPDDLTRR